MHNPFAGIGGVKPSQDSSYVTPGHYVARIDAVVVKTNRKGGDNFIVEMTILDVLRAEEVVMNKETKVSNKKGAPASHLIPFTGAGAEMALPNIKAFALTVVEGYAEADEAQQEKLMPIIVGKAQPLAGLMVEVVCRAIVTKKGNDFSKVTYADVVSHEWRLQRGLITQEDFDLLVPKTDDS